MFKKNGLNLSAAILAIFAVIVTTFSPVQEVKATPRFTDFFWRLDNSSAPLQASSYTSITSDAYGDITCSGTTKVCKLKSNASSLPTNMTDANSDNIPDVTGVVTAAPTKN